MNREIKFRGKSVKSGEWVYGYLLKDERDFCYIVRPQNIGAIYAKGSINGTHDIAIVGCCEVIPETVGESINKFDKSSTKMHEGDILLSKDGLRKYAVTYNEKHLCWYLKGVGNAWCVLDMIHWEDYEIIGNIHEEKP